LSPDQSTNSLGDDQSIKALKSFYQGHKIRSSIEKLHHSDLVNLCKLRGDILDNKLQFHLVVMVQGSEVQRLTDSRCLPSEISGIEKKREAINPEPGTLNL
jgi:hypothetical protein